MKKSTRRILARTLTVLGVAIVGWFALELPQQPQKQTLGVQTNPKHELLVRCLEKAQKDYDRGVRDAKSSPAPNLAQIAVETFEIDKGICHNIYGN